MERDYSEIGEQIFNLVDNNKDKINSFYDALNVDSNESKRMIKQWFENNVNTEELKDLYKKGENTDGLYKWINSSSGNNFFNRSPKEITQDNISTIEIPRGGMTDNSSKIHKDIEDEDDEIFSPKQEKIKKDMSDGNYSSNRIDDEDELDLIIDAIEDGSDEDIDIIFDVIDGSENDDEEDSSDEEQETEEDEDESIHKKRIHLDHHVNKIVESIDDEEEVDRYVHKKYYVMKKKELGSTEKMNDLEDELDKQNISYYDFGKNETIAIKIYESNEVKINRILVKLNFKCRCVDIAHYTDNWNS